MDAVPGAIGLLPSKTIPCGLGTGQVESLTGYAARISARIAVPTPVFVAAGTSAPDAPGWSGAAPAERRRCRGSAPQRRRTLSACCCRARPPDPVRPISIACSTSPSSRARPGAEDRIRAAVHVGAATGGRRCGRGLLKVEQLHALARAVYYGQRGRISAREVYDQVNACSCLTLIPCLHRLLAGPGDLTARCGARLPVRPRPAASHQPDRVEERRSLRRDQDRPRQAQDARPLGCISAHESGRYPLLGMRRQDYFGQGSRGWLRLHEKGGKRHDVPAHHRAAEALDKYVEAAELEEPKATLFQSVDPAGRRLTGRTLQRRVVLAMIKRRAAAAGLPPSTCCHTFRATGITAYLSNGGPVVELRRLRRRRGPRSAARARWSDGFIDSYTIPLQRRSSGVGQVACRSVSGGRCWQS